MMNECACKHEKFVQTDIQGYVSVIGRRSLFILYLFVDFFLENFIGIHAIFTITEIEKLRLHLR